MTLWLRAIQGELAKVRPEDTGAYAPDYEGCSHDHEVGVVDGELRCLYALFMKYAQRAKKLAADAIGLPEGSRLTTLEEASWCDAQADALKELFFASCRQQFPELRAKEYIGIRTDWKMVWCEHGNGPGGFSVTVVQPEDLLRFFGGGEEKTPPRTN